MSTITGAALAEQRIQLKTAIYALYGLHRVNFDKLVKGQAPMTPTVELIYRLTTRYPEVIPRPPSPPAFLELLAAHGVTRYTQAARLVGRTRSAMYDYLGIGRPRPVPPSQPVAALMGLIQRFLASHPLSALEAIVDQAPAGPDLLRELEQRIPAVQLRELLGVEPQPYSKWKAGREPLPTTLSISCRLLNAYPELAHGLTVTAFAERMRRHGVESHNQMSLYLGRHRQLFYKYLRGVAAPAGPTLALMRLIVRFLDTHPLAEYLALVQDVAAARGVDPKRLSW